MNECSVSHHFSLCSLDLKDLKVQEVHTKRGEVMIWDIHFAIDALISGAILPLVTPSLLFFWLLRLKFY